MPMRYHESKVISGDHFAPHPRPPQELCVEGEKRETDQN